MLSCLLLGEISLMWPQTWEGKYDSRVSADMATALSKYVAFFGSTSLGLSAVPRLVCSTRAWNLALHCAGWTRLVGLVEVTPEYRSTAVVHLYSLCKTCKAPLRMVSTIIILFSSKYEVYWSILGLFIYGWRTAGTLRYLLFWWLPHCSYLIC